MPCTQLKRESHVLIPRLYLALSFFSRFQGLMGRASLPSDEGVLFPKCNSIHTFFMRFSIDVVFLNAKGEVVEVLAALAPWRFVLPRWRAQHALELAPGRAAELGIIPGVTLTWEANP